MMYQIAAVVCAFFAGALFAIAIRGAAVFATRGKKRGRRNRRRPAERETNTSNVILVIIAVFLLAFILTMIVVFCIYGAVPDTLIQYTLGAGGVEAVLLAAIKISKVMKGHKAEPEKEPDDTDDAPAG